MPLFVIERNFAEQLEITNDSAAEVKAINDVAGVSWLFSFLSGDKKKTYCLYEAPSAEAIVEAARRAGLPADAVTVQQRFDGYSRSTGAPAPVSLRIGISAGDVVHQDGDIFGTPVVEAARLEGAADPGQILCSEMVRMLARGRGGHEFDLIGMLELKGLPEPLPACSVRWERAIEAGASSFPLPPELSTTGGMRFIGRDDEVQNAIALSTEVEQAHALWVLGEPGIGKTRLATEVAAQAHAAGALVVFGR